MMKYRELEKLADIAPDVESTIRAELTLYEYARSRLSRRSRNPCELLEHIEIARDFVWEGESCRSEAEVCAALDVARDAIERNAPDAAMRLRALGKVETSRELGAALQALSQVGPMLTA